MTQHAEIPDHIKIPEKYYMGSIQNSRGAVGKWKYMWPTNSEGKRPSKTFNSKEEALEFQKEQVELLGLGKKIPGKKGRPPSKGNVYENKSKKKGCKDWVYTYQNPKTGKISREYCITYEEAFEKMKKNTELYDAMQNKFVIQGNTVIMNLDKIGKFKCMFDLEDLQKILDAGRWRLQKSSGLRGTPPWGGHYARAEMEHIVEGKKKSKTIYMHSFLLGLEGGNQTTGDHIDPARTLDNRRRNLRSATKRMQLLNQHIRKDNNTGFRGITYRGPQLKQNKNPYGFFEIHVHPKGTNGITRRLNVDPPDSRQPDMELMMKSAKYSEIAEWDSNILVGLEEAIGLRTRIVQGKIRVTKHEN